MVAPTTPNPTTKAPGVSGNSTAATSPNVGAGYKLPTGAVVNAYGQIVLNPNIGSALAPLASAVTAPLATAATLTAPKAPAPAAKAPVLAPVGGGSGSSGNASSGQSSGSSGSSGSGSTTAPVITLASSSAKGGSTKNSDGSLTFTPTGNVPTDLAALAAAGADALTISYYMSIYGNSWNYGIGNQGMSKNIPQNPPREVDGHMLTTNTPGMSQAEANAVAILNKAGLTQQAVKNQAVYVFTDPTNPKAQISVSKAAYDASTPAQQLAIQIQVGNIPKGATIPKSAIVNGVWNGDYTVPGNNKVQSSGPTPISKYTTTNADGSQSVNLAAALAGGVTADFSRSRDLPNSRLTQAQEYNSVMTQLKPYASGSGYDIQKALADGKITSSQLQSVGFSSSVINRAEINNSIMGILNNPKNGIKTADGYNLGVALANKNVTVVDLQAVGFSAQVISQAETSNAIMAILNNPKNGLTDGKGGYYLTKALTSKAVTNADLLAAGFSQAQIDAGSSGIVIGTGPAAPGEITWSDFKADPANKIPATAIFTSFNSKTGTVNYTVPSTATAQPVSPTNQVLGNGASTTNTMTQAAWDKLNYSQKQLFNNMVTQGIQVPANATAKQINNIFNGMTLAQKKTVMSVSNESLATWLGNWGQKKDVAPVTGLQDLVPFVNTVQNWKGTTTFGKAVNIASDSIALVSDGLLLYSVGAGAVSLVGNIKNGAVFDTVGNKIGNISDSITNTTAKMGDYPTDSMTLEERQAALQQAQISKEIGVSAGKMGEITFDDPDTEANWKANLNTTEGNKTYVYNVPKADQVTEVKSMFDLSSGSSSGPSLDSSGDLTDRGSVPQQPKSLKTISTGDYGDKISSEEAQPEAQPEVKTNTKTQLAYKETPTLKLKTVFVTEDVPVPKSLAQEVETYNSRLAVQPDVIVGNYGAVGTILLIGSKAYQVTSANTIKLIATPSDLAKPVVKTASASKLSASIGKWLTASAAVTSSPKATVAQVTETPAQTPSKAPTEVPQKVQNPAINPAINPSTVQQSAQQKAQQKAQSQNQQQQKAQQHSQQQSQSQQQDAQQDMSQEMQPAVAISGAVNTLVATATDVQPPPDSITPILAKGKKPAGQTGELTDEQIANAAAAHKAGFGWWYFVTGLGWRFSIKPPPGAKAVKDGKGSGYASVQTIKGKPVVSMHRMGAVNVTINRPTKQPGARGAISYRAAGTGRPGLSATRLGQTIHIKGVGVARRVPRGRILN